MKDLREKARNLKNTYDLFGNDEVFFIRLTDLLQDMVEKFDEPRSKD